MKRIVVIILTLCALSFCAFADDEIFTRQAEVIGADRLEEALPEQYFELEPDISFEDGVKSLTERVLSEFKDVFLQALSCIGIILAISVIASIVSNFHDAGSERIPKIAGVIAAVSVTAASSGSITSLIGMGTESIESMSTFSKALLPSMAAAVAAGGSPLGATARYTATVLFSDIALTAIGSLLIPLVYIFIAVSTANAAIPDTSTDKICDFLQWIITGCLKIIVTAFVGYITVSGVVATTVDLAGAKTAQTAISTAVPVVGGILSEAAGTVVAGAAVLKNAIGVFGMLSIMSVCLTPFLILAVNYFTFKVASAIIAPLCDSKISELVGRIGASFGIVLGMSASCAFLLFISIISCMHATGVV